MHARPAGDNGNTVCESTQKNNWDKQIEVMMSL